MPTLSPRSLRAVLRAALFAGLLFGVLPSRAQAEAASFALNWVRGEGAERCASSQLLARAIEQFLGPVLQSPSEAALTIEGTVSQPRPGQFEVRTRVLTPAGDVLGARTLTRDASDCSALTPAILLVLSLTIDPEAAAHGFPTELLARLSTSEDPSAALLAELRAASAAPALAQVPPAAKPVAPVQVATAARALPKQLPLRRWHGRVQAGPAFHAGLLPRVTVGASLAGELSTPWRLAIVLAGAYWSPAAVRVEAIDATKHVRFGAAQGQLAACLPFPLPHAALQLLACVGGVLGARWADASALSDAYDVRRMYGGPLAQLALRYDFSQRLYAGLDVAAGLLFRRDRFTYRDDDDEGQLLFRPHAGALWSSLHLGVRL
jgi:hypothetical protein